MSKHQKKAAPKSNTPRRQTALSRRQGDPKAKAGLLRLKAQDATGVPDGEVANVLVAQAAAMAAQQTGTAQELLQTAMHMLGQIKPEGALQSMLAVQMIGVHNSAVRFLMRASAENQTFEGVDANVMRSTRLMRVFDDQLEAFAKLKGKTFEQKVVVKHVHVHEGAQAIVGSVTRIGEPIREEGSRFESGGKNEN
jgi:trans-aconitate methyltransferase